MWVAVDVCVSTVNIVWMSVDSKFETDNFLALIKVRYHHYNHDHQETIKTAAK